MTENNIEIEKGSAEQQQKPEKRRMKKGWKITLISLGSLLGLVVVLVAVALWLVLTPARLTSLVNRFSDKFILCENHFDDVDLTVFKTFPYVGLNVQGVTLINPVPDAPNDTLAHIDEVGVGFNIRQFLKHGNIEVKKLVLNNAQANIYVSKEGKANYDIFKPSEDTSASEPFKMPDLVSLKCVKLKHFDVSYLDESSNMRAGVSDFNLGVDGKYNPGNIDAKVDMDIANVIFNMSSDSASLGTKLDKIVLRLDGATKESRVEGDFKFFVDNGRFSINDMQYVNDTLFADDDHLLVLEGGFTGDADSLSFVLDDVMARLKEYSIGVDGSISLPKDSKPMAMDVKFKSNKWKVDKLLASLPAEFTSWQGTMRMDAVMELSGTARGEMGDGKMPLIGADLTLNNGSFEDRSMLPFKVDAIAADIHADLDLSEGGVTNVDVNALSARANNSRLSLKGHIADLLGTMVTDATVSGSISLPDVKAFMPKDMNLDMKGKATPNLKVRTNLQQLQNADFAKMVVTGDIGIANLDVVYDTIYAQIPKGNVNVRMPSTMKRGLFKELLSATISADALTANMPNQAIDGSLGKTRLHAAISDIFDTTQPFRLVCDFDFANIAGNMDSMSATMEHPVGSFAMIPQSVNNDKVKYQVKLSSSSLHLDVDDSTSFDLAGLSVDGGANYDPSRSNTLQQWSPNLDVQFKRGYLDLEQMDYIVQIPDIKFNYKPEICQISNANVVFGNSDFYLSGAVTGLEKWLSHEDMLKGDLYFTSNFTNVDDLMEAFSGMGSDADTLEAQRREDNVDTSAHPFIVPRDVDFTLHTRIKEAIAFENDLREVAGDVQIKDGIAVLNQVGFVCKAAKMQLTGMYRTPRVNHIFVGLDFHLLDINIQELIDMIPYVDTIVPLLNDLEGAADFHLCAETYVNAFYKPKMSTLRAAAALTGQNLTVLNNKDIDRIAKLLQLKRWREDDTKIHLDSLDVAMTVFRNNLEVYPFLLSLHKYQIVAEGRHDLDNNYDYHVEIVESPLPVRLAVDVFGTMPKLHFDLSPKLRYKNLYRPAKRSDADKATLRLKENIRRALEANVKQDTRDYEGLEDL